MDDQVKNIIRYAIVLFIITALSASLLAGMNMLTKDKIDQNSVVAEQKALQKVMEGASGFEAMDEEAAKEYGAEAVYTALREDGSVAGYCVKCAYNGYGGEAEAIIGIDADMCVTGFEILSHSETPGLGANITKDSFKDQFKGKSTLTAVVKAGAKDSEINAVSGATISSKAITEAVNSAIDIAKAVKEAPASDTDDQTAQAGEEVGEVEAE